MKGQKLDTVTVEVVRNLLMSIAEETYGVIIRSAYSTNMKERHDVCTAVIDPEGNSVAQVESLAALLGSMLSVVPNIYEKFGRESIQPGDMFIANDPYHGGGNHLPTLSLRRRHSAGIPWWGGLPTLPTTRILAVRCPGPPLVTQTACSRRDSESLWSEFDRAAS